MSGNPWIRFFPSDWLAGTRGMTASESGIYITLVALMYERGGEIENCPPRLCRLCGSSNSAFKRALENLISEDKIIQNGNMLSNQRVVEELSYTREKSSVARESANRRWGKKPNNNSHGPDANAMRWQCDGNANQKPETRKKKDSTPKPYGAMAFKSDLMAVLNDDYAQAVIDHRKAKRAPFTKRSAKLFLKSLSTCTDPLKAIDMMIERNWTTVNQEWMNNASNGNGKTENRDWKKTKRDEAIAKSRSNISWNEGSPSSPERSLPMLLAPEE